MLENQQMVVKWLSPIIMKKLSHEEYMTQIVFIVINSGHKRAYTKGISCTMISIEENTEL